MPVNVVKTKKDETLWKKAKDAYEELSSKAKKGIDNKWAYIMGLYKKFKLNANVEASTKLKLAAKILEED